MIWHAEENLVVNNKDNSVFVSELSDSCPLEIYVLKTSVFRKYLFYEHQISLGQLSVNTCSSSTETLYRLIVFRFILVETFPALLEMFHSLDVWHKAKKLTKALHQVFNTHNNLFGELKNVLCFGYMWTM